MTSPSSGRPLAGVRVVELQGLGPAPHAAMVMADLGAEVTRVERVGGRGLQLMDPSDDPALRGRARTVAIDLKDPAGELLDLLADADILIEGFRPGVTERLGIGPQECLGRNPSLVYVRITGWGQDGPWASHVGHDINYVGLTGALHAIGAADRPPPPPLNLIGDFGGGSMLAVVGALAALVERSTTGRGQVVDAAMVDGTAMLSQMLLSLVGAGSWSEERQSNLLDGAAPFYRTYACADGRYVAVGPLEPHFYAALLDGLGLDPTALPDQYDRSGWTTLHDTFERLFATRDRDDWAAHFEDTDACVTPVLTFTEAADHPHLAERGTYVRVDGHQHSTPAPRFTRPHPDLCAE